MEKNGGRPKKETSGFEKNKTIGFQEEKTKIKPNENVNVNENDNVNVNVNVNDNENDLYLTLFNKYKKQIEEQPNKVVQIISKMKETSDYALLTLEEQDQIFYDLMNPEKRSE